jgi:hypothetical protein
MKSEPKSHVEVRDLQPRDRSLVGMVQEILAIPATTPT